MKNILLEKVKKVPKTPKGMFDKDSAKFHKEFLDNEDEVLDGLRKIIASRQGIEETE